MRLSERYRFFNLISLDVVLGAVCCSLFFSKILQQPLRPLPLAILALTVWCVYTFDHLRDGIRLNRQPSALRHGFHRSHFSILKTLLGIGTLANLLLAIFLPVPILATGFIIGALVGLYLLLHHRMRWAKEIFISILYTVGILAPFLPYESIDSSEFCLILCFVMIAFLNLVIFSWFDHDKDMRDGHNSIATILGKRRCSYVVWIVFIGISALLLQQGVSLSTLILFGMALAHILIFAFHQFFAFDDRFRLVGEAIFYLPAIYLLFQVEAL
jgi:hypothetical protein